MYMEDKETLPELLSYWAQKKPDEALYTFLKDGEREELSMTYGELDIKAKAVAAVLRSLGGNGERVLLLFPPGLSYIAAFFGCLYEGSIAVPLYPPRRNRHDERLQAVLEDSGAKIALTTKDILEDLQKRFEQAPLLASLKWVAADDIMDKPDLEGWSESKYNPQSLAYLQYTSGSTSTPKGVMIRHDNVIKNLRHIHRSFGHSQSSRGVIWLPPYHDMGLVGGILQPLYGGFHIVLMDPVVFMQKPLRWLKAISNYRGTSSGGPDFAYNLCIGKVTPEQIEELDLSSWDLAFNGAEPIRAETMERFSKVFAPCGFRKEAFYPCYGLAESTLIVSGGDKLMPPTIRDFDPEELALGKAVVLESEEKKSLRLVGCGQKMSEDEIAIVDTNTLKPCEVNCCGEIWVSGGSVADGYWKNPEETESCFGAYTSEGKGPFLRTGDIGFFCEDELYITGRLKDLIIIRGRNHYPQDIELTVEKSNPSLHANGCAAFSIEHEGHEELVVVQEAERSLKQSDMEEIFDLIRRTVANRHELRAFDIVLVRARSIPRTSSGKIRRFACKKMYLEGNLMVLGRNSLQPDDIDKDEYQGSREMVSGENPEAIPKLDEIAVLEYNIRQAISRILRIPASRIENEQPLNQSGLDSLMAVELQQAVEEKFFVSLPLSDLMADCTLKQIVDTIYEKRQAATLTAAVRESNEFAKNDGEYPASHGQQGLWFIHSLNPKSSAYNITGSFKIEGELNTKAITGAFDILIRKHDSLRTVFKMKEGQVIRIVMAEGELALMKEDASHLSISEIEERMLEEAHKPFDIEKGPLFRIYLFHKSEEEHYFLFTIHHIISDFWSLSMLAGQFDQLYSALSEGKTYELNSNPFNFTDYTYWQKEMLKGERGDILRSYWGNKLKGELPVLNMPTDFKRPALQTYEGASVSMSFSNKTVKKLRDFSRTEGTTLYTVLLAAYNLLLNKYTRQDEFITGTLVANRDKGKDIFGYFVNAVALRINISDTRGFKEIVQQVKSCVLEAFAHQDYPFDLLVEQIRPKRDLSHSPLFQSMFSFQKTPGGQSRSISALTVQAEGQPFCLGGLNMRPVPLPTRTAQFDLTMTAAELGENDFTVALEYNKALFREDTAKRMLAHYRSILEKALEEPELPVSNINPLSAEEYTMILNSWNRTQMEYDKSLAVHSLIEKQASLTPKRKAVVSEDMSFTYRELMCYADGLAEKLSHMGVGPGSLVGVCLKRSARLPATMLAILKTGAAYVPLDATHPRDRLAYVLEEIGGGCPPVLVTEKNVMDVLTPLPVIPLYIDDEEVNQPCGSDMPATKSDVAFEGSSLAYIIYTSGSTGRPKGVEISHRALVNFLLSMAKEPGINEDDILLSVTTPSFDIAGLELFLPLIKGAQVVVASNEAVLDGARLSTQLETCGVTIMQATPATWRLMLESGWKGNKRLKALCGGEPVPVDLADILIDHCREVWNMYGPTETTVWSTVEKLENKGGPVYIGRPIANTRVYVLDSNLKPVPVGVPGELHIGGDGLARGYFKKDALTKEKFIPDPFIPGGNSMMYRTGDLARFLNDGRLEHLGRLDNQVKIRGFRIELEEISSVIIKHEAVRQAVVSCRENSINGAFLAAYMVMEDEGAEVPENIRDFLKGFLPEYMVPASFTVLKALPLTPNGKVDRKALPEPSANNLASSNAFIEPAQGLQRVIAEKWQQVLGLERVGAEDNFFDLGGHSILMAKVLSLLKDEGIGIDLSIVEMFQYPTVKSLAQYLDKKNIDESSSMQKKTQRMDTLRSRQTNMRTQREMRRELRRDNNN